MNRSTSKIVLVTGASSGIGAATAHRLAADGHHVVLGARRTDRLATVVSDIRAAGGAAEFQELDVTSLESMCRFADGAHDRHGRIDALVNNAGVMSLATVDALRVEEWDQMIDVNLRGTLNGVAAVLPHMRAHNAGHIINVGSTAAYRVDPTAAVYCATKFAVRAFTEGLRQECREVRVTLISPGYTESELNEHGGDPAIREMVQAATGELGLPASAVADAVAYAIAQPAAVDVNEIVIRSVRQP
jgi:NADP-dependent 3-hydroxy acid dehydrogenase YdfG